MFPGRPISGQKRPQGNPIPLHILATCPSAPECDELENMLCRKILKFLPLLVLLLLASCNRDPKVQAQRELENANKFFAKAKYREAALMYKRALQKDMRFGEAYYRLALTELKLSNYGDAMRWLQRAVELQPNNTDAITKLADLYLYASMQVPA